MPNINMENVKINAKNVKLLRQMTLYFFTGGTAFFVDAGTLYLLNEYLHVFYLWAACAGFCLGLLTNYFLSLVIVFRAKPSLWDFTIVLLIGLIGLGLTEAGLYVGHGLMGMPVMLVKLFVTAVVFLWNFAARKLLVYRD